MVITILTNQVKTHPLIIYMSNRLIFTETDKEIYTVRFLNCDRSLTIC